MASAALPPPDDHAGVDAPTSEAVLAELERIIASPAFDTSGRNRRFLRHLTEETLAGRADSINASRIATSVFERDEDFDPQSDPIVRLEAIRLRRALDE